MGRSRICSFQDNAEIIVKELNTIINDKINMMNEKGVIIASTDQERIGQEHEGAKRIINDRLEELIIHSHDRYEGSLEGVTVSDYHIQ